MDKPQLKNLLDVAAGREAADLVIKNANIVDVYSGTVMQGDIALCGGLIAGIGSYSGENELDAAGQYAAPGFIDSCSNYIETAELIAQRIERFADFVGKDRVWASSDCGFGTFAGYGKIDPKVAWKKLAALREGADIAESRIG